MEIRKTSSSNFTRIFDILQYQQEKYPNKSALNSFRGGSWQAYRIDEIISRSEAIACWLIRCGYSRGEKIIFVPESGSPEWMILDFACQQAGLVVVPMHPTAHEEEILTILKETESRLCLTADVGLYYKFSMVFASLEQPVSLHHLDPVEIGYFKPIEFTKASADDLKQLNDIRDHITEEDVLSIMYTSGSSGVPKGVLLTHRNVVSGIKSILTLLPLEAKHRVISFLPFSHIFERVACYAYLAFGVSVYFSQNKESFTHDLKTVKPYFCTSVPRVLEKMYDYMLEQTMQKNVLKRKLIRWSMEIGKRYRPGIRNPWLLIKLAVARWLVLSQWRKKLGGRIRYMVVGAASLRPEIGRLFSAAGIHVVEGYGMTETAPFISTNRFEPGQNRFGTVGIPVPGVSVKIDQPDEAGEGEILVKGDNVMKGYYKHPDLKRSVFTEDGWFRTGDVGKIVHQRFLKITDRKKDIFKTSSGKYIAPQPLQNHFMKSPFIARCLILGFQKPYVAALLVPNTEMLEAWCKENDIHWTSLQFMVYNIKVRTKLQQEIDRLNEDLPNYQRVKDFVMCHQDWTIEAGELTNTLKPVRHLLMEHYQKEIDKMYP